jgi:hypothetical protein
MSFATGWAQAVLMGQSVDLSLRVVRTTRPQATSRRQCAAGTSDGLSVTAKLCVPQAFRASRPVLTVKHVYDCMRNCSEALIFLLPHNDSNSQSGDYEDVTEQEEQIATTS